MRHALLRPFVNIGSENGCSPEQWAFARPVVARIQQSVHLTDRPLRFVVSRLIGIVAMKYMEILTATNASVAHYEGTRQSCANAILRRIDIGNAQGSR